MTDRPDTFDEEQPVLIDVPGHDPDTGPVLSRPSRPRMSRRTGVTAAIAAAAILVGTAVGAYALGFPGSSPSTSNAAALGTGGAGSVAESAVSGLAASMLSGTTAGAACTTFMTNLASQLKVTTDALQAAVVAAAGTTIDKEVADGVLSATQGAAIKARLAAISGPICSALPTLRGVEGFEGMGPGGFGRRLGLPNLVSGIASALGTTPAALRTEIATLPAGSTVCTLATKHNVSCDTLKTSIRSAVKAQLDADVKAGTIGQAVEDRALSAVDAWLQAGGPLALGKGFGMGPGMMGPGGMGGWHLGPGASPDDGTQTQ